MSRMAGPCARERRMSFHTQDSTQHQTTSSGPKRVGAPLGTVPWNKSKSHRPDLVGLQFGCVKIYSPEVLWRGRPHNRMYVKTECVTCGRTYEHLYTNLKGARTKGCRNCNQPVRFPLWIYRRVQGQEQRCINSRDPAFKNYGGRGIEFRFSSVSEGALWVKQHLGVPKDRSLHLDRIENDGHYEPGNIRWSTSSQNNSHVRKPRCNAALHRFRQDHPEIRYADSTLRKFFSKQMTFEQIIERFYIPSNKPKGKYGTFLTPDPFIVSLHKDS